MKTSCQKPMLLLACRHSIACISKITNTTDRTVNHEGSKVKVTSFGGYKVSVEFTSPKLLQNVWMCLNSGQRIDELSPQITRDGKYLL